MVNTRTEELYRDMLFEDVNVLNEKLIILTAIECHMRRRSAREYWRGAVPLAAR